MSDAEYGYAKQALGSRGSKVRRIGDSYSMLDSVLTGFVSQLNMVPEVWRPLSAENVERLIAEGYLRKEDIITESDKE